METRYYQEEAKAAFFEDYEQNPIGGSGLIYAATGAGKTVMGADIGKSLNQPLLFLVHRDELAEQTISKFLAVWKGVDIGLVKAKHNQLGATVTVASIQTLANEKRLQALLDAKKYSLVIQDECFPAGTLVDGKPIEQIRVGDYVDSFNHSTGRIEKKRVDQVMKKKMPDHMFKLYYGDNSLICTPNHPIYVNHNRTGFEGYALAEDLHLSKGVSVYAKPSEVCQSRNMQWMGGFFKKFTVSQLQEIWKCLLLRSLQKRVYSQTKLRNNESNKPESQGNSFKTHERKQSFFQSINKRKGQPIIKSDWSQTEITGWQWNGVDGTSKIVTSEVVTHDITSFYPRNGDQNKNKRSLVSSLLQSGYRLLGFDAGNRSGWEQSHLSKKEGSGQEKTGLLRRTGLDCVEILEQRDYDKSFGGIGENYVYNISVEDNHNYFANGILVHNCHHAPSPTWEKVLRSVPAYRLGLTATPVRSDEVALDGLFSKVLYKYSVIDGIKDGYLVDIQGRQIDINMNLDGIKCQAGDFSAMALADVMTNAQVMDVVYTKWNEYASNLKTVAFCCDVNHAKLSAEYFSLRGVNAEWIAGSMDYDTRKAVLRRFSRGQTQVLFNCMILTEGWDEPSIECVMMLRPTSSESLYIQMLGRGLRLYPGKSTLVVLDFIGATQKHKLMQFGDLTGVPYPKVAKVKPTGEPMDKYMPSVRDVLIADDKAIDVYKNQARAFNWVRSGDNLALQIGFNHYLVVRPGAESGYEAVNCHLVAWQYQEKVIYKASTVDICLSVAEEQAENLAKKKDALSFQQADREFGQRVTQKQAEMLSKYKQPVPATAKEAASMIGKLFFDTFQRKANAIASPDLRNMIKAQQYQGMLGCKISLEQIDKLKQIEAEKIQKFYLNGGGFKRW